MRIHQIKLIISFIFIAMISPILCQTRTRTKTRTLVIGSEIDNFNQFLEKFKNGDLAHEFTFLNSPKLASSTNLIEFEELLFDNLIILDSSTPSFGGALKMGNLVDFVNKGGNILLVASEGISDAVRDFAFEFTVDFKSARVVDPWDSSLSGQGIVEAFVLPSAKNILTPSSTPIYYAGNGHVLTGKNDLIKPLLVGKDTAYMTEAKKLNDKAVLGSRVVLASYFQALNGARVVFASSSALFGNEFLKKYEGNRDFAAKVAAWVFQESGVVRVKSSHHHRLGEKKQHGIYRIKDEMVYELQLEEKRGGNWEPYIAPDVQFEAVMLDPYIRVNMTPTKSGSTLKAHFKLPDQYGVFTFKVDYKRRGLSRVLAEETVQVRPFRHDQYPRFLLIARPYYSNIFVFMGMFFVVSAVFLFYKEAAVKKVKTE